MTKKEECIVKHAVNCGAPKYRLKQFLLGMESIEKKVHPVSLQMCTCSFQLYCVYPYVYSYFLKMGTVHFIVQVSLPFREY